MCGQTAGTMGVHVQVSLTTLQSASVFSCMHSCLYAGLAPATFTQPPVGAGWHVP
eukprot:COSAG01_NODE_9334_length_2481_cov_1.465995_1_plen_54_part_10